MIKVVILFDPNKQTDSTCSTYQTFQGDHEGKTILIKLYMFRFECQNFVLC